MSYSRRGTRRSRFRAPRAHGSRRADQHRELPANVAGHTRANTVAAAMRAAGTPASYTQDRAYQPQSGAARLAAPTAGCPIRSAVLVSYSSTCVDNGMWLHRRHVAATDRRIRALFSKLGGRASSAQIIPGGVFSPRVAGSSLGVGLGSAAAGSHGRAAVTASRVAWRQGVSWCQGMGAAARMAARPGAPRWPQTATDSEALPQVTLHNGADRCDFQADSAGLAQVKPPCPSSCDEQD
jgi:hypothetical protein